MEADLMNSRVFASKRNCFQSPAEHKPTHVIELDPVISAMEAAILLNLLDCWMAPCMSGRFYTEPQEQRLFVWKEVARIRENKANPV